MLEDLAQTIRRELLNQKQIRATKALAKVKKNEEDVEEASASTSVQKNMNASNAERKVIIRSSAGRELQMKKGRANLALTQVPRVHDELDLVLIPMSLRKVETRVTHVGEITTTVAQVIGNLDSTELAFKDIIYLVVRK